MLALLTVVQPQSTTAGVITAVAALIIAIGGLLTAVGVLVPLLRSAHRTEATAATAAEATAELKATVDDVHVLVNQQHTDMQNYQAVLVHALRRAGIDVPLDQSKPIPDLDDA